MYDFVYPVLSDTEAYLRRIGYEGSTEPTLENLDALILAHQLNVPFETLDVVRGTGVSMEADALYEKVVLRRRGGYCFELNNLFLMLLRALGYDAYACMARVASGHDHLRPVRHRGSIVKLGGKRYYCDVGFGGTMAPFAVELDGAKKSVFGETYWAAEIQEGWQALYRQFDGAETTEVVMIFGIAPFLSDDFNAYNYFTSANPDSPLRREISMYRRLPDGYANLRGTELSLFRSGEKEHRSLTTEELPGVAKEYFDLEL